jgi:hypothetical protein
MAGSPEWKVYDAGGTYQAACKEPEAAGAVVALYGHGATIRWQHSLIVWREGSERTSADDSYDYVANMVRTRVVDHQRQSYIKRYGKLPAGVE